MASCSCNLLAWAWSGQIQRKTFWHEHGMDKFKGKSFGMSMEWTNSKENLLAWAWNGQIQRKGISSDWTIFNFSTVALKSSSYMKRITKSITCHLRTGWLNFVRANSFKAGDMLHFTILSMATLLSHFLPEFPSPELWKYTQLGIRKLCIRYS